MTALRLCVDVKMHAAQTFLQGCWLKCCQKCCVEKHVDSSASQPLQCMAHQSGAQMKLLKFWRRHANFPSVNVSRGLAIRRESHLIGWQRIKGRPEQHQQQQLKANLLSAETITDISQIRELRNGRSLFRVWLWSRQSPSDGSGLGFL